MHVGDAVAVAHDPHARPCGDLVVAGLVEQRGLEAGSEVNSEVWSSRWGEPVPMATPGERDVAALAGRQHRLGGRIARLRRRAESASASSTRPRARPQRLTGAPPLDLDHLLEGRPVDPVDQRLLGGAERAHPARRRSTTGRSACGPGPWAAGLAGSQIASGRVDAEAGSSGPERACAEHRAAARAGRALRVESAAAVGARVAAPRLGGARAGPQPALAPSSAAGPSGRPYQPPW